MIDIYQLAINSFEFILPAYIANATPVIFKGKKPIDFGKNFIDGKRIFGDGKTFEGFISGLFFGTLTGIIMGSPFRGFLLSFGALIGDLIGAFIKRRLGIPRGKPAPLLDQLDFIFGALLLSSVFYPIELEIALFIIIITPPIHLISNIFAYLFKLKNYPF
ncbi:MAG: CDP-2,3-bis-(O-geranylgeranyl)-sn-glycerol synthase [Candidatus Methanomethylicia archaeon]|jgi:CDP-2,3-bis-(O-geranylgeranyl)-sn-glycerol synthase|nr:CDP-2,3-bis-(O-geranylgeranyl)-sn-glycerol synthase [Candidatus Methanomethylicia archaeon]